MLKKITGAWIANSWEIGQGYTQPCYTVWILSYGWWRVPPWRVVHKYWVSGGHWVNPQQLPQWHPGTQYHQPLGHYSRKVKHQKKLHGFASHFLAFYFWSSLMHLKQKTWMGLFEEIKVIPAFPKTFHFSFSFHKLLTSSYLIYSWLMLCFRKSNSNTWHVPWCEHKEMSSREA